MIELLTAILVLAGAAFSLIAALGVLRMPDLLIRMHAATKAGALGCGLTLLATAVGLEDAGVSLRALATIVFVFLTTPLAGHALARAAYRAGALRLWEGTRVDEPGLGGPIARARGREKRSASEEGAG